MNNPAESIEDDQKFGGNTAAGVVISIFGSLMIGSSFVLKKYGLLRSGNTGYRASQGGFGYLKDKVWWGGMLLMTLGESLNFFAYMFAPATIITLLGGVSVLVSILLSRLFLQETLCKKQKLGCLLIILGTTILIIVSPSAEDSVSFAELCATMRKPAYIGYTITSLSLVVVIAQLLVRFEGIQRSVVPYLLICSILGTLTVSACKALGITYKQLIINRKTEAVLAVGTFFTLELLVSVIVQIVYLNKALDMFTSVVVTPVYYTFFTLFVIAFNLAMYSNRSSLTLRFIFELIACLALTNTGVYFSMKTT